MSTEAIIFLCLFWGLIIGTAVITLTSLLKHEKGKAER